MSINDITFRALSATKRCEFCEGSIHWSGLLGTDVDTSDDRMGNWKIARDAVSLCKRNSKYKEASGYFIELSYDNKLYTFTYKNCHLIILGEVSVKFCPFCGKKLKKQPKPIKYKK